MLRKLLESLLDSTLDDVLEVDDPEDLGVTAYHQGGCPGPGNLFHHFLQVGRDGLRAKGLDEGDRRVGSPLAVLPAAYIDAGEAGVGAEGNGFGVGGKRFQFQVVFIFRQYYDAPPFRGLVGQGRHQGGFGHLLIRVTAHRDELHRLTVPQGDGAGLVEQKHVYVTGCLDGAPRQGNDVLLEEAVHPGDTDGGQECGDGGGRQADEERHQDRERDWRPMAGGLHAVDGEGAYVGADQKEDQGKGDEEHLKGDLVGGLAPLGPLDEGDHPVEESLPRIGGYSDDDGIGDHHGAAGDGAPVPARLAHHRGRLAGNR